MAKKTTKTKKPVVKPMTDPPACPPGYYRNSQGKCVPDIGE
jgi:hypothetical protein